MKRSVERQIVTDRRNHGRFCGPGSGSRAIRKKVAIVSRTWVMRCLLYLQLDQVRGNPRLKVLIIRCWFHGMAAQESKKRILHQSKDLLREITSGEQHVGLKFAGRAIRHGLPPGGRARAPTSRPRLTGGGPRALLPHLLSRLHEQTVVMLTKNLGPQNGRMPLAMPR